MSKQKVITIERVDASTLKPKKPKPFDIERFRMLAKSIQEALKEEEKLYGKASDPAIS